MTMVQSVYLQLRIVEYDGGGLCDNGDIEFPCGGLVDTVAGIQVWYSTNLKEYESLSRAQPTTSISPVTSKSPTLQDSVTDSLPVPQDSVPFPSPTANTPSFLPPTALIPAEKYISDITKKMSFQEKILSAMHETTDERRQIEGYYKDYLKTETLSKYEKNYLGATM